MSAIAAVWCRNGASGAETLVRSMMATMAHRGPDGIAVEPFGPAALGHALLSTLPEDEREPGAVRAPSSGAHVVADARIDNRDEIQNDLGAPGGVSDTELVALAYDRWGESFPRRLFGDFAVLVWDPRRRRLVAARDALGARRLFFVADAFTIRCATEMSAFFADPKLARSPDLASLAAFLVEAYLERYRTVYAEVRAIPPGHVLVADATAERLVPYWQPSPDVRIRHRNERDYDEHFRTVFLECVRARLRSRGPVAVQLSGGIDSSAMVGAVEHLRRSGRAAASVVPMHVSFPGLACDEAEPCRAVVDHWGLSLVDVPAPDDPELTRIDRLEPRPESYLWTHPLTRLWQRQLDVARERGIRIVLSGLGADQLLVRTQRECAEALREGRLKAALRLSGVTSRPTSFCAWRHLAKSAVPEPALRAWRRVRHRPTIRWPPWLSSRAAVLIDGTTPRSRPTPSALRRRPATRAFYEMVTSGYELVFTLATIEPIAAYGGVDVRCPFLDRRLVELMLAFPAELRGGPFEPTKPLLRRALGGELPEAIRTRTRGTEFTSWMRHVFFDHHGPAVDAMVRSTRLEALGLVDGARLEELVHAAKHDWSLVGQLANVLSLEAWLRSAFP